MSDIPTQAAAWLVKLSAEDPPPTDEDRAAFVRWKDADPRHATAVQKMEAIVGRVEALPGYAATHALENVAQGESDHGVSWTGLAKTLCWIACVLLPLWFLMPATHITGMLADKRTATGQWATHRLSDQSRVTLSSHSAINIAFTAQQRTIELIHGDILVDVATDVSRPFVVKTRHGAFTALGTRFTVRHNAHATTLTVLESRVQVSAGNQGMGGSYPLVLTPHQRVTLYTDTISGVEAIDAVAYEDAWRSHELVVYGQPLAEVLARLRPYHKGYLSFDAAALTDMPVYAVLPLDEPQRALRLLSDSFPIEVEPLTPWWVRVNKNE